MKTVLVSVLGMSFLGISAWADIEPSVQWTNMDGSKTIVTHTVAYNEENPAFNYFGELPYKKDVCYNGDAKKVLEDVINDVGGPPAYYRSGDEDCSWIRVKHRKIVARCTMGLPGASPYYKVKIKKCDSST